MTSGPVSWLTVRTASRNLASAAVSPVRWAASILTATSVPVLSSMARHTGPVPLAMARGAKRDSQPEAAIGDRPCHERSHSLSLPEPVTKPLNPRKKDGAERRITDR